jgi:hypothetical protein
MPPEEAAQEIILIYPTHVVVDTRDGFTWARDGDGTPFTEGTARAFTAQRNAELAEPGRTYRTFALLPMLEERTHHE